MSTEITGGRYRPYTCMYFRLQPWGLIYKISYDNAAVTIDLRQTFDLPNILRRTQNCKVVIDSVCISAYDIPKRNLSTL